MMATKQIKPGQPPQEDISRRALTMALGILVERIQSLPQDDRKDLSELMKELAHAESGEELDSVIATMEEVLDREPIRLEKMDQSDEPERADGLQKWIDFVSARIKELRSRANLTREKLAKMSGLSASYIADLENSKHSPSRKALEKLAEALKIGVETFDFST